MPTETWTITKKNSRGVTYVSDFLSRGWQHSPRSTNGKLLLQNLPYSKTTRKTFLFEDFTGGLVPSGPTGYPDMAAANATATNQAYGRLRGKLYKGSAALGVSIASYKQSREMISSRADQISRGATKAYETAMRSKKTHTEVASGILEAIFGWKPLLEDIHSSLHTVIQGGSTLSKYAAAGIGHAEEHTRVDNASLVTTCDKRASVQVRYVTNVLIKNPNTWLAERAGLLNPASVAWDLVPWSFVVNMFVNTGSLVNSITDFAGLELTYQTTTIKSQYSETRTSMYKRPNPPFGKMVGEGTNHTRSVGVPLQPPSLEFRIPEANWELAAIAASLMVQKVTKLGKLYSKLTNQPLSYTE